MIRINVLILAGLLGIAGCSGGDSTSSEPFEDVPEADRYGGTAVVTNRSDIPDINPLTSTETMATEVQQNLLFLPLIAYDENLEPVPLLARSWEVSQDTTLLTFHLRDDIYWHDGVKTSAYDVDYSYRMANNPETAFPNTAFWTHYGESAVVDSFTFQVEMRPHADFMDPWRTFPPVPEHIFRDVPASAIARHPFNYREPVGNGPFRFAGRVAGQSWTFDANPDFPEELGGRPYLDRIVYRAIPEPATALTELLIGGVDFLIDASPDQTIAMEADPNARVVSYDDRSFIFIAYNQRREPFDDVRVRRALSMSIDRQSIVDAALYGYGDQANSTVPPFFWQYDEEAGEDVRYNPDAARALLRDAGFTPGPDGILRNPDGEPFQFTLFTNQGNQARADIAEIVQADLSEIGVDLRIQIEEFGTLLDRMNDPVRRNFDAVMIGWRTEFRIDDTDLFHCDKINEPYQWTGNCDPELDRLMDILPTIPDRAAALPLWKEYQERLAATQPMSFVYFQERIHGAHRRLRNFRPDPRGDFVGAAEWYIAPDMRRTAGPSTSGSAPTSMLQR